MAARRKISACRPLEKQETKEFFGVYNLKKSAIIKRLYVMNVFCFIFGPIAQLGERTVRIRKVVGSIPIRSTKNGNRRSFYCGDFPV